jgi:hypothetical protein
MHHGRPESSAGLSMMRPPRLAVLAVLALLALPSASGASHDPGGAPLDEDFVTGTAVGPVIEPCTPGCRLIFVFDARSGPSGESPTGTVRVDVESPPGSGLGDTFDTARVTCLNVTGNRATIVAQSQSGFVWLVFGVEDNDGAGQDRSGSFATFEFPGCPPNPSAGLSPLPGGDVTVHDAVPSPTSKEQCKNEGWKRFPGFKNQGHCVRFVATGAKHPSAGT